MQNSLTSAIPETTFPNNVSEGLTHATLSGGKFTLLQCNSTGKSTFLSISELFLLACYSVQCGSREYGGKANLLRLLQLWKRTFLSIRFQWKLRKFVNFILGTLRK